MAASGFVYEGERNAAGQREGYGTMRWADGDVYEGQWKGGEPEGRDDAACQRRGVRGKIRG